MNVRLTPAAAAMLVILTAGICRAADAIEPGKIELYPTYSAVGIEVPYKGDDNGDATAEFVWRKSGQIEWRNGVDVTIDRKKRFIWASVWPLDEDETVEVKLTVKDPQAKGLRALEAAATTKEMALENSGGRKYYVGPEGSDENPGSEKLPFKTLAHAATLARPGDTVYALPGVYREGGLFKGLTGEPGKPIIITAAEGAAAVIDGSVQIEKGDGGWKQHGPDMYVRDFAPETGYAGYVAQDGLRMFWYRQWAAFTSDRLRAKRAWHFDRRANKLYVRTGDAAAPRDHAYNVAVHEWGLDLSPSRHVVVRGFEIRYFGYAAVRLSDGAAGCVVAENTIHNAPAGVLLRDEKTVENAIWKNEIYEPGLVDFTWNAVKGSRYPRQGVTGSAGRGISICHNDVSGFFDGICPVSWRHPDDLPLNRDMDIMYNRLKNIGDDAIEIDGGGVNMRIHQNTMRNVFAAISLAPVERGPVYCTRNDATYYMLMFKLNVGGCTSLGWAYSYHNSGYCLIKGPEYGGIAISFPAEGAIPITNKVFKNNAFIAKVYGIRSAHEGEILDHNCFSHVPGAPPLTFTWEVPAGGRAWRTDRYSTLADFTRATGQEKHGLYADPQFVSTPDLGRSMWRDFGPTHFGSYPQAEGFETGDMRLKATSPCIDAGAVVRGVNEDFSGKAPDMGAFEYGAAK